MEDLKKIAERIAFRMTDGGNTKIFVNDVTGRKHRWLDWHDLAELIAEELEGE